MPDTSKTNLGQVIQIARGDLISRLKLKPLAYGELFIHTAGKENISKHKIFDLVTNSVIQTINEGDLFAGHNNSSEVYFLGSGGSLKWGGILFEGTSYEDAVAKAKEFPEHLFMYNGANTLSSPTYYLTDSKDGAVEATDSNLQTTNRYSPADTKDITKNEQIGLADRSYVAKDSAEWAFRINPGDVIFYSSVLSQVVVLHLSRSTDALTKINVDELISSSMQNWLKEIVSAETADDTSKNYYKNPSTLKTFLDKPVRHYQYLVDTYGWRPTILATDATDKPLESIVDRDAETGTIYDANLGTIRIPDPCDGAIYYVPFSKDTDVGLKRYQVEQREDSDGVLIEPDTILREGDLLLAIPNANSDANPGSVKFAVVSLYSALLEKFRWRPGEAFARADSYATDIWRESLNQKYVGDREYNTTFDTVQDFLDRLFQTKVDVDPTTGKIISSQLPDFLLGAPKYMGHFDGNSFDADGEDNDTIGWASVTSETTAEQFAAALLGIDADLWKNLDKSEDDDTTGAENENNVELSKLVNDKLKTGCYWIYQGESQDISTFKNIFHLCDDFDDFSSGEAGEEDLTEAISSQKKLIAAARNKKSALSSYAELLQSFLSNSSTLDTEDAKITTEELTTITNLSSKIIALDPTYANLAVTFVKDKDGNNLKVVANWNSLKKEAEKLLDAQNLSEEERLEYEKLAGVYTQNEEETDESEKPIEPEVDLNALWEEFIAGKSSEEINKATVILILIKFIDLLKDAPVTSTEAELIVQYSKYLSDFNFKGIPIIISLLDTNATEATISNISTFTEDVDNEITEHQTEIANLEKQLDDLHVAIRQRLLNKGDWVIFNGGLKGEDDPEDEFTGRFEVIDNSSSFLGILVGNVKVNGVAVFENVEKDLELTKAWKSDNEGRVETKTVQKSKDINLSASNNTIKFQNEDKVFAAKPEVLDSKHLPKISEARTESGNATLVNSRFEIIDDTNAATKKFIAGLRVTYPTGYKDTGDAPNSSLLQWHYDSSQIDKTKRWSYYDLYGHVILGETTDSPTFVVTTKPRVDYVDGAETKIKATGLNFDWIPFMGNTLENTQYYSFAIEHEEAPNLFLPSHSGILATENYVNQGFTVVKTIINDVYEKTMAMHTRGHINWLQTIRQTPELTLDGLGKRNEIYDSQFLQEVNDDMLSLKLFYGYTPYDDTAREANNKAHAEKDPASYVASISSYKQIDTLKANKLHATLDYKLGSTVPREGNTSTITPPEVTVLNPSERSVQDPQPEQVLPNHSGILLNNNSVIDGGEW